MLCLVSVRYRLGAGLFIKVSIMVPTAFQRGYPNTSGFRKVGSQGDRSCEEQRGHVRRGFCRVRPCSVMNSLATAVIFPLTLVHPYTYNVLRRTDVSSHLARDRAMV
jgi:hypothetical protein